LEEYLQLVVPALLVAGGRPLSEVATKEHWQCHTWTNCPMAAAFLVTSLQDIPLLHRARVEQFTQLFDAGLVPLPKIAPAYEETAEWS
ncbi:MAG: hypothetical protein ACREJW_07095, partial [Candidatus Methylomirabilales bacterium]